MTGVTLHCHVRYKEISGFGVRDRSDPDVARLVASHLEGSHGGALVPQRRRRRAQHPAQRLQLPSCGRGFNILKHVQLFDILKHD